MPLIELALHRLHSPKAKARSALGYMFKSHPDDESSLPLPACDWGFADVPVRDPAFTSLRQLLAPRELPEAESLSEPELILLLSDLEFELLQHHVRVDFLDALPARVAYRGILQHLDSPLALDDDPQAVHHLDGCDSACESCFKLAHCRVAREVLGTSEWRLAVEQAGINPSWTALFGTAD